MNKNCIQILEGEKIWEFSAGGYDKPGKGVDKNEPKKKGFFLFFDIVIRKFTNFWVRTVFMR